VAKSVRTTVFLILSFFFVLGAWAGEEFYATVSEIVDGDTIWVQTESGERIKVRLVGIDTPEEHSSRKLRRDASRCEVGTASIEDLGELATVHLKELLQEGDTVKIISKGHGYYGRLLAYVVLPEDGTNVNYQMVEDGYACVYTWHGKKPDSVTEEEFDKLVSLMQEARSERDGLWEENFQLMNCLCSATKKKTWMGGRFRFWLLRWFLVILFGSVSALFKFVFSKVKRVIFKK